MFPSLDQETLPRSHIVNIHSLLPLSTVNTRQLELGVCHSRDVDFKFPTGGRNMMCSYLPYTAFV